MIFAAPAGTVLAGVPGTLLAVPVAAVPAYCCALASSAAARARCSARPRRKRDVSGGGQLLLAFEHPVASGLEDFMPAACNRDALAWLERWPAWPAPALVLHGPPGCGKSHLARIWAARVGASRLDPAALPAAASRVAHPRGARSGRAGRRRDCAPAAVQPAAERGGHLLLTARQPVAAWTIRLADLASRLRAAPAVAIGPPDDGLLAALLVKLFDDRQLDGVRGVIGYLIRHMERSFAAARAVVEALDAHALQRQGPVTVALARSGARGRDGQPNEGG